MIEELINREKMNFGNQYTFTVCYVKRRYEVPKSYILKLLPTGRKPVFQMPNKHMNMHYKLINLKITKHILMINDRTIVEDKNQFYPKERHLNGFKIGR